jgi:phage/plasmid primase-like uncharacterized protein
MTSDRYVSTPVIRQAVKGRETEVLEALRIAWQDGAPHIRCPYAAHTDHHASWRWDQAKARAYCTCIERGGHSIFDIVMRVESLDFEAAKLRIAEILGRTHLIKGGDGDRPRAMDAERLLQPSADQRDGLLPCNYLGHRLGVAPDQVMMPSTPAVGWRELPYYDPPARKDGKAKLVGRHPCVVFGTIAQDDRKHAYRIYTAPRGAGKAELGVGPDGRPRDAKKSARLKNGQSAAGCSVLWGDRASAPHLLLAEGIETSAALAFAHRAEIEAGDLAVAAALSTGGIRAFVPWPATRKVTIAADRDENKPKDDGGFKAGEKAARAFARAHHERLEVRIALPGEPGQEVDWLDVLRSAGPEGVRTAIAAAQLFEPAAGEGKARDTDASSATSGDEAVLSDLAARAAADPSVPFERAALRALAAARRDDPPGYQRTIGPAQASRCPHA